MRTQKMFLVPILSSIAIACLSQACAPLIMPNAIRDVRLSRSQAIEINTQPPGAHIWIRDANGTHPIGTSPVTVADSYIEVVRKADKGACAAAGAGEGFSAGLDIASDTSDGSKAGAAIGLIAMIAGTAAGAAVGAEACKAEEGIVAVESSRFEVVVVKEGYMPERHTIILPRKSSRLDLELIPDPRQKNHPEEQPEQIHEQANRPLPKFRSPAPDEAEIQPPSGLVNGDIVYGPKPKLAIYAVKVEAASGSLDEISSEMLTGYFSGSMETHGFTTGGEDLDEGLGLDARFLRVGDLCIISATLFQLADRLPLRVGSARAKCQASDLAQAVERIAAQLAPQQSSAQARGELESL